MDGPLGNCLSQNCSMTRENKRCKKDWFSPSPPPKALQIPSHLLETASSSLSLFVFLFLFCFFFKKSLHLLKKSIDFWDALGSTAPKSFSSLSPSICYQGFSGRAAGCSTFPEPPPRGTRRSASPDLSLHSSSWKSLVAPEVTGPGCSSLVQEETDEAALFSPFGDSHWSWSLFQECNCFIII